MDGLSGANHRTSATPPAGFAHDRLSILKAHGLDEAALNADPAAVTALSHADLQPFQSPQAFGCLFRKEAVEFEITAAITAIADGEESIGRLHPQPD